MGVVHREVVKISVFFFKFSQNAWWVFTGWAAVRGACARTAGRVITSLDTVPVPVAGQARRVSAVSIREREREGGRVRDMEAEGRWPSGITIK